MSAAVNEEYPAQYENWLTLKNGEKIFLRPIQPTDEPLLVDLFNKMSPQSRYLRFLSHHKSLSEDLLYRLTHIDYKNEFALAGVIREEGKDAIIAVGRYSLDPQENIADLAIAVRDDWQHCGLGKPLLAGVIEIGKHYGISRFGSVIDPQNRIMKTILEELGYDVKYSLRNGAYEVEILV